MGEAGVEKRRFPRYACDLRVTVYMDTGVAQTRIAQISRGGCLIFPALPSYKTPEVKVSFALKEGDPPINCKGEIVYNIKDRGTGVAFTEISMYNQERITEFFQSQPAEKPAGS
jgi:hypothetical protein